MAKDKGQRPRAILLRRVQQENEKNKENKEKQSRKVKDYYNFHENHITFWKKLENEDKAPLCPRSLNCLTIEGANDGVEYVCFLTKLK